MSKAGSTDVHRNYPSNDGPKFNTMIEPRKSFKQDWALHPAYMDPMIALNQEYIDAGAAADRYTPLCWGIPRGKACRRMALPGGEFCQECDDDRSH